jgi:hypothetical protein
VVVGPCQHKISFLTFPFVCYSRCILRSVRKGHREFILPLILLYSTLYYVTVTPVLTPIHLSSIMRYLSSAQALLDVFISMSQDLIRCSPVMVYARTCYAVIILVKISVSTVMNCGALHGVLQAEVTRVAGYLRRIARKLTKVSA